MRRTIEKIVYSLGIIVFALFIIFGTTYAFILANLTGGETTDTITITSAGAECAVTPGPAFNSSNEILPGWSETYTFSVTNNTEEPIIYNILFTDVVNTFVNKEQLVFTLASTNTGGTLTQTELPSSNGAVLSNITIPARTTQEYTLTVSYLSAGFNQIDDLGATFSFRILIDNCGEEGQYVPVTAMIWNIVDIGELIDEMANFYIIPEHATRTVSFRVRESFNGRQHINYPNLRIRFRSECFDIDYFINADANGYAQIPYRYFCLNGENYIEMAFGTPFNWGYNGGANGNGTNGDYGGDPGNPGWPGPGLPGRP